MIDRFAPNLLEISSNFRKVFSQMGGQGRFKHARERRRRCGWRRIRRHFRRQKRRYVDFGLDLW